MAANTQCQLPEVLNGDVLAETMPGVGVMTAVVEFKPYRFRLWFIAVRDPKPYFLRGGCGLTLGTNMRVDADWLRQWLSGANEHNRRKLYRDGDRQVWPAPGV